MASGLQCPWGMLLIRSIAAIVATSTASLLGCSSTAAVLRPDLIAPNQEAAQANAITHSFAGKKVDVEVASSSTKTDKAHLTGTLATSDGKAFLLLAPPEEAARIPFESIRSITYRNRLAGAGEGLLVGGLSGGLTGFLLTAVVSSSICDSLPHPADGTSSCHTNSSIVPVVASTVVGGLVGALIGSHVGHRTTLTF